MSKVKTETVEVTKGFLEYRESELRKSMERLRAARAKLRDMERENAQLRASLDIVRKDNERLGMVLRRRDKALSERPARPKATTPAGAVKDARLSIECVYATSRERALALTKLDECELWLGRCEPKETAAPTLEGAAQDAAMPCLKDVKVEVKPEALAEQVTRSLLDGAAPALRMAVE